MPDPVFAEDFIPVNISGLELGDGGIAAVAAAFGPPDPVSAFEEIQAVADTAAGSIVVDPADEPGVHAALQDEILHQAPDRIVRECRDDRAPQSEAAAQSAHHIVFAAAFPDLETAGGMDPARARIEPEHDLAQTERVKSAAFRRFIIQHDFPFHLTDCFSMPPPLSRLRRYRPNYRL